MPTENQKPGPQTDDHDEQRVYWIPCVPHHHSISNIKLCNLETASRVESWLFPMVHLSMFSIEKHCLKLKFLTHTVTLESQDPKTLVTDILSGQSDTFRIPASGSEKSSVSNIAISPASKEYHTQDPI